MADPDVTERLAAIERRLDRLELLLGATRPNTPSVTPAESARVGRFSGHSMAAEAAIPVAVADGPAVVPPRPTLEQAIGLRWAGWAGAIVLVIGAGLGIDFAYRQGWFASLPPAARVGALVAVAAALIGAGEVVYRRVNVRSAVGLFAAGVAVLYLAAYAGHAFYGLYGRGVAFGLMAAATVVGAAVARRGDLVSIAALSIVGGNLAPALLRVGEPEPVGFLVYLLTLQLVAVALAFRGGPKWWVLRGLSLASTALWVATVLPLPTFAGGVTVGFLIAYAVVFHAERIASAALADETAGSIPFGACVTAALAAGLLVLSRNDSAPFRTTEVLMMAAATAALAAGCARGRGGLPAVAVGFLIQCVGLIVLAVPVATSGAWVVAGWGLIAIALAVAGRWSMPAAYAAPLVWLLAAFDLLLWADRWVGDGHADRTWFTVADRSVPAFAGMAWLLAVGGHVIAAVTRRNARLDERAEVAGGVDTLSAVAWVAASVVALPPLGATAAVLGYGALATALAPVVGTAVAVAVALKWMAWDTLATRPDGGSTWTAAGLGVAVVAVLVGVGWANRRRVRGRRLLRAFTVVVAVWAGSVLVDAAFSTARGRQWTEPGLAEEVALSVLWAASAAGAVAAGFGRRLPDLRYVGLSLFAVTLVKVVAVDLAGVAAGYRILSFLGLGGLLLATSVLYGRLGGAAGTVTNAHE